MNAQPSERNMPLLSVDIDEIRNRIRDLENANLCGNCELAASRAVSDIARLIAQIHDLYAALGAERLRSANLEAAIRAVLGAYDDGETDPLAYLRDEMAGSKRGRVWAVTHAVGRCAAYGARCATAVITRSRSSLPGRTNR